MADDLVRMMDIRHTVLVREAREKADAKSKEEKEKKERLEQIRGLQKELAKEEVARKSNIEQRMKELHIIARQQLQIERQMKAKERMRVLHEQKLNQMYDTPTRKETHASPLGHSRTFRSPNNLERISMSISRKQERRVKCEVFYQIRDFFKPVFSKRMETQRIISISRCKHAFEGWKGLYQKRENEKEVERQAIIARSRELRLQRAENIYRGSQLKKILAWWRQSTQLKQNKRQLEVVRQSRLEVLTKFLNQADKLASPPQTCPPIGGSPLQCEAGPKNVTPPVQMMHSISRPRTTNRSPTPQPATNMNSNRTITPMALRTTTCTRPKSIGICERDIERARQREAMKKELEIKRQQREEEQQYFILQQLVEKKNQEKRERLERQRQRKKEEVRRAKQLALQKRILEMTQVASEFHLRLLKQHAIRGMVSSLDVCRTRSQAASVNRDNAICRCCFHTLKDKYLDIVQHIQDTRQDRAEALSRCLDIIREAALFGMLKRNVRELSLFNEQADSVFSASVKSRVFRHVVVAAHLALERKQQHLDEVGVLIIEKFSQRLIRHSFAMIKTKHEELAAVKREQLSLEGIVRLIRDRSSSLEEQLNITIHLAVEACVSKLLDYK